MATTAGAMPTMPALRHLAIGGAGVLALLLGGCAGNGPDMSNNLIGESRQAEAQTVNAQPQTELEKATGYWGDKFSKSPQTLEYALNYARNLKAMGRKREALAVLQQASSYHGQNRELAGEYGRLALELDQVQTAKSVLAFADDPTKPDWRIISARGTALAKEGSYKDAIPHFQRAMALSNSNPSVMNNLAMAYALNGQASESEQLLRQAAEKEPSNKAQKNLALVLGLQGKYDEAKMVGTRVLPHDAVASDTTLLRQMVKLDPKPYQPVDAAPTAIAKSAIEPTAQKATAVASAPKAADRPALRASTGPEEASDDYWDSKVAAAKQAQ